MKKEFMDLKARNFKRTKKEEDEKKAAQAVIEAAAALKEGGAGEIAPIA